MTPIGAHRDRPLEDILREVPHPFAAPIGIAPIHDIQREGAFDPLRPVAAQRAVGMLKAVSTKPAIWQGEPWVFSPGQHALRQRRVPVTTALGLVHLKFVDADLLAARQSVRQGREMSAAQAPDVARHWRRDPAAMKGMQIYRDAAKLREGPRLLDEMPGFLDREFDRVEGGACHPVARRRIARRARRIALTGGGRSRAAGRVSLCIGACCSPGERG